MKISIVVPIYNTAGCLAKCINSILAQSHQDIEVILVNDGSTDNSGEIIRDYAVQDSRVVVIEQKNAGQSAARNRGVAAATGDYIGFVDSDDIVAPDYVEKLLAAHGKGVALTACGFKYHWLYNGREKDVFISPFPERMAKESRKAYVLRSLVYDGRLYSVANKLFLAKYAKKCAFSEELNFAEDTKFVLDYLAVAKGEIKFVLEPLYYYNFGTPTSTVKDAATKWENWRVSYKNLKAWVGRSGAMEKFWLMMVYARWRVSHLRSRGRARKVDRAREM